MKHIAVIVISTLVLSLIGAMAYATTTPIDNNTIPTMLVIDTEESDDETKMPETVFGSLDAPHGAIKLISTQGLYGTSYENLVSPLMQRHY